MGSEMCIRDRPWFISHHDLRKPTGVTLGSHNMPATRLSKLYRVALIDVKNVFSMFQFFVKMRFFIVTTFFLFQGNYNMFFEDFLQVFQHSSIVQVVNNWSSFLLHKCSKLAVSDHHFHSQTLSSVIFQFL